MTNEDALIIFLFLVLIGLLLWLLCRDTTASHSGATEPSRLPPPPEPRHSGPWFLHIRYRYTADCPDLWYRADSLQSVVGDPKTHRLVIHDGSGEVVFRNVDRYTFEQLSQMGDWLITEDFEQQE